MENMTRKKKNQDVTSLEKGNKWKKVDVWHIDFYIHQYFAWNTQNFGLLIFCIRLLINHINQLQQLSMNALLILDAEIPKFQYQ